MRLSKSRTPFSLFFFSSFFSSRKIKPSARGELEIPDAVKHSMEENAVRYQAMTFDEGVLDLSSRDDISSVQKRLKELCPELKF